MRTLVSLSDAVTADPTTDVAAVVIENQLAVAMYRPHDDFLAAIRDCVTGTSSGCLPRFSNVSRQSTFRTRNGDEMETVQHEIEVSYLKPGTFGMESIQKLTANFDMAMRFSEIACSFGFIKKECQQADHRSNDVYCHPESGAHMRLWIPTVEACTSARLVLDVPLNGPCQLYY